MQETLTRILRANASPDAVTWLENVIDAQRSEFQERPFYYAFSGVSRHFDKTATVSAPDEPRIDGWDEFRVARILLLLVLAEKPREVFLTTWRALLNTADLREQVALFSALPWSPYPEELLEPTVDGLRTNVVDIFDAIALDNSFPAEHFSEEAWNQMVLKAIFIARPLYRVEGVDRRGNAALAEAISDLAHERWSAGRDITPEAWRSCIDHLDERLADDVRRVAGDDNPDHRAAAALVLHADGSGRLDDLRDGLSEELARVDSGDLTWTSLGRALEENMS